jgi:predicted RND superfamily exporter protein
MARFAPRPHRDKEKPSSRLREPRLAALLSALINLIVNHPRLVIGAVLLLTALFALGFRRGLPLDVSPLGFVEKESRERTDFDAARRSFGDDLYLVVALVSEDAFAPARLARLRALHQQIDSLAGVAETLSLVNVPYARSAPGGAAIEQLIPDSAGREAFAEAPAPPDPRLTARLAEARRVATSDRLFAGHLVSPDGRTTALNVLFQPELPTAARHELTRQIYELARASGFAQVFFAGDPFSQWRGTEAIKRDLKLFLPLTLLLIAALLWRCFRSWLAVALPLASIGIGLIWLFGLMALIGARFTILALMLPTLLLAIGCSYIIHVLNQVGIADQSSATDDAQIPSQRAAAIVRDALKFIAVPVVVSALTIMAGFLSLAFTAIPAIRETAVFAALGAAFTLILSLTFVPASLVLLNRRQAALKGSVPRYLGLRIGLGGGMVRMLERVGRFATGHQTWLYVITGIIVIISLAGMRRIKIDIDYFHFFRPSSETSVGVAEIGRRLAGAVTFDLVIEGPRAGALEDRAVLERISELQAFAESGGMSHTLSVVDFLKHLNRAFHDGEAGHYAVPAEPAAIAELLSDRRQIGGFLTEDGRTARILVRSTLSSSRAMSGAIAELEQRGRELLPGFRVFATGTFVLLNRTSDLIAADQRQSLMIALLTIYAMLALLFRSWRVGVTALVPNLIPVLFFFGFMGWQGIPLNLTTSLVASVVLGLAVDNAVQFIVRFRSLQQESLGLREAIIQSLRLSGRPIIYANIALASAFAVFAFSTFEPIQSFGLLSAVTILGCVVEDLVLLPARLTSPVFRVTGRIKDYRGATARQQRDAAT